MPEPLKNLYSKQLLQALCKEMQRSYGAFEAGRFMELVLDDSWAQRELKQRMEHISKSLHKCLPSEYPEAVDILQRVAPKFVGFEYMFFPGFVELYGMDDYEVSITALANFTEYASSEFAVRPFIKIYGSRMMTQMSAWAVSDNLHMRRLASEGCRPRLPWAMALPEFKQDPGPILPILEKLKADGSEYVRRSVANNLNDIAKDNPGTVVNIAGRWLGNNPHTDRLVKHACRTLLKRGQPEIMRLFGFVNPAHITIKDFAVQEVVNMGRGVSFSFTLRSAKQPLGKLRIEYAIDFMKKNGKPSRKLFMLSESQNTGYEKPFHKMYSFRKISTRKYYTGTHGVAVIVNGHELAGGLFELQAPVEPSS